MKAIILCAGKGTRLGNITETIPKVMVDVSGKPCLQYNIELLKKHGITDIAINTHHFSEKIKNYFGDGSKFGVNIKYSYEPELLGTSGALNNFRDFFNNTFIVIYGDVLHQTDLTEMLNFHKEKNAFATLALDNRTQISRGAVILEGERIVGFKEKPEKEIPGALVNSGVYIVELKILDYIQKGFSDFGKNIFPRILEGNKKLCGFKTGKIIDIGTPEILEKARKLFGEEKGSFVKGGES